MSTNNIDAHIARALEAFNDHNADGVADEFAEEGTFYDPPQDEKLTKPEFREYCKTLLEAFPDVRMEEDRAFVTPGGAAIEWTFSGTHEAPIGEIPPTGKRITLPGVSIITTSDDGITSWRDYWDQQNFVEKLGIA